MLDFNFQHTGPIYEKLRDELRRMLITGALAENEKLPSVRELASSLAINPNTIQRAYRELEADGYVYSIPGKGSFAASGKSVDSKRRTRLMDEFQKIVSELNYLGIPMEELTERISAIFQRASQREGQK